MSSSLIRVWKGSLQQGGVHGSLVLQQGEYHSRQVLQALGVPLVRKVGQVSTIVKDPDKGTGDLRPASASAPAFAALVGLTTDMTRFKMGVENG